MSVPPLKLHHRSLAHDFKVHALGERRFQDSLVARERDARLTNEVDWTGRAQGVVNGFPLKIVPKETREVEVDFNAEFLTHMLPKMEWSAFVNAAKEIGLEGLPSEIPDDAASDEEFLRTFHHALLEVHVEEGTLVCPESGRKFPINKGIPNMLLNEDEV